MANEQQKAEAKHTPGPWEWDGDYLHPVVFDHQRSAVHTILGPSDGCLTCWGYLGSDLDKTTAEDKANRQLMAAAPDLLGALKIAEEFMSGFEGDELQVGIGIKLLIIRDAITKATVIA